MNKKQFVLIDLERTIGTGVTHYWKAGKRGYTRDVHEVGKYPEDVARDLVLNDFDRQTVAMSERRFNELAGLNK